MKKTLTKLNIVLLLLFIFLCFFFDYIALNSQQNPLQSKVLAENYLNYKYEKKDIGIFHLFLDTKDKFLLIIFHTIFIAVLVSLEIFAITKWKKTGWTIGVSMVLAGFFTNVIKLIFYSSIPLYLEVHFYEGLYLPTFSFSEILIGLGIIYLFVYYIYFLIRLGIRLRKEIVDSNLQHTHTILK